MGHLNRRGLPGEHPQAVAGGVAGQIDQQVDLILADQVGDPGVRQPHDGAPVVGRSFYALGHRVGMGHVGVAENLELGRDHGPRSRPRCSGP